MDAAGARAAAGGVEGDERRAVVDDVTTGSSIRPMLAAGEHGGRGELVQPLADERRSGAP